MFDEIPKERKIELFQIAKGIKDVNDVMKYSENYQEQVFMAYTMGVMDAIDYLNAENHNKLISLVFR